MSHLREKLAAYAHRAWSGWMQYIFNVCGYNSDGTLTIPADYVSRWRRQLATIYSDLPEKEKKSDRDEADRILNIFDQHVAIVDPDRPTVVCLCGSTRFFEAYQETNFVETMKGNIVLSVGFYAHRPEVFQWRMGHGEKANVITDAEKDMLDELHKRKIDLSDEIFVINVDGYIGESTKGEIEYARQHGKRIRWLESPQGPVLHE